jgi:3-polyprenyl-4-hydroxybenzoate decarboxylase
MNTKRLVIGIGIASGAALAAWLLTGSRRKKTTEFISKKASVVKQSLKKRPESSHDSDALYI